MNAIKALLLCIGATVLGACHANGSVEIKFETSQHPDTLMVSYSLMSDLAKARRAADVPVKQDTLVMMGNKAVLGLSAPEAAQYRIFLNDGDLINFYAAPGDNLYIQVSEMKPMLKYTVAGSALMDGITELDSKLEPIQAAYDALVASENPSPEKRTELIEQYDRLASQFIKDNPDSPAASYALLNFDGKDFLDLYALLTPKAKESMFYPVAQKKADSVKANMEKEEQQARMMNGTVTAPDFTLKDLKGKDVSLSQFRGKYVVIDFWGSWCIWCIKGFPKLKEAYAQYKDKMVVLGVDCQDSDEAWRKAVEKYELPWVNVYNPQDSQVLNDYRVQGFPTKVIVNPEGKIVNITTGEDPAFYDKLASFLGK